jgi:hypothetical protein
MADPERFQRPSMTVAVTEIAAWAVADLGTLTDLHPLHIVFQLRNLCTTRFRCLRDACDLCGEGRMGKCALESIFAKHARPVGAGDEVDKI